MLSGWKDKERAFSKKCSFFMRGVEVGASYDRLPSKQMV
jgi:hypothetical protein